MGYTSIETKRSFKDILERELNRDMYKVLDHHYVEIEALNGDMEEGIFYCAVEHPNQYIFGMVVKFSRFIQNDEENVAWKEMDEGMLPYYFDCPERIIKQLTPVKDLPYKGKAEEWRNKCLNN